MMPATDLKIAVSPMRPLRATVGATKRACTEEEAPFLPSRTSIILDVAPTPSFLSLSASRMRIFSFSPLSRGVASSSFALWAEKDEKAKVASGRCLGDCNERPVGVLAAARKAICRAVEFASPHLLFQHGCRPPPDEGLTQAPDGAQLERLFEHA